MKYFFLCIIASLIYLECTPKAQTFTGDINSDILMSDLSSAGGSFKVDTSLPIIIDTSDVTIIPGSGITFTELVATNKIDTTSHRALISAYDELMVIDVVRISKYVVYGEVRVFEDEVYLMPDFSPIPEKYIVWLIK